MPTWEKAADSVERAKEHFNILVESKGRRDALAWFDHQVYLWAKGFSSHKDSQFAWTLGKAMDGGSHTWAIRQTNSRVERARRRGVVPTKGNDSQTLALLHSTRWKDNAPEPLVTERTIRNWITRLASERFEVVNVTRDRKQDLNGPHPGSRLPNLYEVNFDRVIVNDEAVPWDFMAEPKVKKVKNFSGGVSGGLSAGVSEGLSAISSSLRSSTSSNVVASSSPRNGDLDDDAVAMKDSGDRLTSSRSAQAEVTTEVTAPPSSASAQPAREDRGQDDGDVWEDVIRHSNATATLQRPALAKRAKLHGLEMGEVEDALMHLVAGILDGFDPGKMGPGAVMDYLVQIVEKSREWEAGAEERDAARAERAVQVAEAQRLDEVRAAAAADEQARKDAEAEERARQVAEEQAERKMLAVELAAARDRELKDKAARGLLEFYVDKDGNYRPREGRGRPRTGEKPVDLTAEDIERLGL